MKPSKSPNRFSFQQERYLKRMEQKGEQPNQDYLDYFQQILEAHDRKFDDLTSRLDNMEWDLLTADWILEKARADDAYAQNLYAAMCNNEFTKLDVVPILTDKKWSCSWRYAGGIIADMQQKGDYIDWYCSGIRDIDDYTPENENVELTEEQKKRAAVIAKYVPEGKITDEIRMDLKKLGWALVPGGDWEKFD